MNIIVCEDVRTNEAVLTPLAWSEIKSLSTLLEEVRVNNDGLHDINWDSPYLLESAKQIIEKPECDIAVYELICSKLKPLLAEVCEASEKANFNRVLCQELRAHGHGVTLYDAHKLNVHRRNWDRITDTNEASKILVELIHNNQICGMVHDLQYFSDQKYGISILDYLYKNNCFAGDHVVVIFSRFLHGDFEPQKLLRRWPGVNLQLVDRLTEKIDAVVKKFKK
ncbi:MAG TPA: hypothetical protein VG347_10890 [Verrucomicrobiae bacterium]|nr:hypothetical protein [Verrucomicrobiae bacterium]